MDLVYVLLILFLIVNLGFAYFGFRSSNKEAEDYFLAGRGIGSFILFFTFVATNFSAFFFMGFAGQGYKTGYAFYAIMAFGTAFAAISFYLIGYKAYILGKQYKYITPSELVADQTGSKPLGSLYASVLLFFTLPYLAIQPIGAGYLIEVMTGGEIPYLVGVGCVMIFIVLYTLAGGMKAVAITDMVQGILMFTLMFLAVFVISKSLGGFELANRKVLALKPELFGRSEVMSPQKWFSQMLLWMFVVPMLPQMFMRFYISGSSKAFKTSTLLYAFVPLLLFLCPVVIGIFGHLVFPGLEGKEADKILPMMLMQLLHPGMAGLIMIGALAAFMSTLDSQLLAISTILSRDVFKVYVKREATTEQQVVFGKWMILILALAGFLISLNPPSTIFAIIKYAFSGMAILFPSMLVILRFKGVIKPGYHIVSIAVPTGLLLLAYLELIPSYFFFGFEVFVPCVIVSFLILGIGAVQNFRIKS